MKSAQLQYIDGVWQGHAAISEYDSHNTLVLLFGELASAPIRNLKVLLPNAKIIGCSTAGEILGTSIWDTTSSATVILFEHTEIQVEVASLGEFDSNSAALGYSIAERLANKGELKHLFVLSDGLGVNGAHLVSGIRDKLGETVNITGGLAGDGERFANTFVAIDDDIATERVVAVGFYGDAISVSCGSRGGWRAFGMERKVTRSTNNVLFELDDQNALDIYRSYLGELASGLPATGLRFPLEITDTDSNTKLVRTLLAVNETDGSITFAGNVPQGVSVKLMRANTEGLIDGAQEAAEACRAQTEFSPEVAILISCMGRRQVLRQMAEDEVEAVSLVLGESTILCGFYSYGEIAPFNNEEVAQLHNQTMTITAFSER